MKTWSRSSKAVAIAATLTLSGLAPVAHAQPALDADSQKVLAATSHYVGELQNFTADYAAVDEVVTTEGQKLQFLHSGEIVVQRPNKFHATRRGAAGVAEMFLDGKTLTLYSKAANAYLQFDAPSIDAAIDVVHNFGLDAPGADLLASKPLDPATTDVTSGAHVGMTFIEGGEVHQLAFRGTGVDWQLWVTAGDKPLPLRYVVTTKQLPGAPEFTLQLRNWNTAPQIDAAQFTFTPPAGAKKLDPAAVTVNAIGDITLKGQ
jgi:hypothetical protein